MESLANYLGMRPKILCAVQSDSINLSIWPLGDLAALEKGSAPIEPIMGHCLHVAQLRLKLDIVCEDTAVTISAALTGHGFGLKTLDAASQAVSTMALIKAELAEPYRHSEETVAHFNRMIAGDLEKRTVPDMLEDRCKLQAKLCKYLATQFKGGEWIGG